MKNIYSFTRPAVSYRIRYFLLTCVLIAVFQGSAFQAYAQCYNSFAGSITPSASWQTTGSYSNMPYWSFTGYAGATYNFSNCNGPSEDTYMRVFDASMNQLSQWDDYGPYCSSANASGDWYCSTTATYYVGICHYSCSNVNSAQPLTYMATNLPVVATCQTCPSYDFGIFTPSASPATHSSSTTEAAGCKIYAFSVISGSKYVFSVCSNGGTYSGDSRMILYNSSCSEIANIDDYCGTGPQITWTATYTGTVYLRLAHYSNSAAVSWTLAYWKTAPAGENCSNAQDLTSLSNPFSGSTAGYADDVPICHSGYPDRVFYIDVANATTLEIWEPSNDYDEYEYVGYGSSCPGTQLQCWDNDALAHTIWTNTTGSVQRVWYVQDACCGTGYGNFTLQWTLTAACATPGTPTGLGATLGNTDGTFYWSAGSPSGSANVTYYYTIYNSSYSTIASGNTSGTSVYVSGLSCNSGYYLYVYANTSCNNTSSSTASGGLFYTTACEMLVPYNTNNNYTVCSGHLYDHGGSAGSYTDNASGYTYLYPAVAGNSIQISGSSSGESCCDYVQIYNGAGLASLVGQYQMGSSIPTITSADASGALTVLFHSDGSVTGSGFDITVSCVCATPAAPVSLSGSATGATTASISWAAGSPPGSPTITYYYNVYTAGGSYVTGSNTTSTSASVSGLSCGSSYYFTVYAYTSCNGTTSSTSTSGTFATSDCEKIVPYGGNNNYTACSGHLYDHGGSAGNYTDNANGTAVLYPSVAGNMVQIFGTSSGESCCDYVQVYNGVGTGSLIGQYQMGSSIPTITSSDGSGALTVLFHSDVSVTGSGFDITIGCVAGCVTPGVPVSLSGSGTGETTASISWSAGSPGGSATVTYYYNVYTAGGSYVTGSSTTSTSASVGGLTCASSYYFTVYASTSCNSTSSSTATSGTFSTNACPCPNPCSGIISMALGSTYTGTLGTSCSDWSSYTSCGYSEPGDEVVYSFTPQVDGIYTFTCDQPSGDPDFFLMSSCSNAGTNYFGGCVNAGAQSVNLTKGTTYYFIVDNYSNSGTAGYSIAVNFDPCSNITNMALGSTYSIALGTSGVWNTGINCSWSSSGAEKVYQFTTTYAGDYVISVTENGIDAVWYFVTSCSPSGTSYATCLDAGTRTANLAAGTTYYIIADNYSGNGTITTLVTPPACGIPSAPTPVTATPSAICPGETSQLNAVSPGNTIYWYTQLTGGSSIGSCAGGTNFAVSPGSTTTYYAEAASTGSGVPANILGNPSYVNSGSGSYTLGYSFTPNTTITVTAVRRYFGSAIKIWTDGGTLLANQAVSGSDAVWTTTALSTPITLNAGTTYRIAAFTNGGSYYWRTDMSSAFTNGVINSSYEIGGDAFPTSTDGAVWWLVDLVYSTGSVCVSTSRTPVIVTMNTVSTAPTSISGNTAICNGGSTTLTMNGGSAGTSASAVWYEGAGCGPFTQDWNNQPYGTPNTTVNSVGSGILNVTSVNNDPMIDMAGLGSFDPNIYKYVNIKYRVLSGSAGSVEIFFYNGNHNYAVGGESASAGLYDDGAWHVVTINMASDPDYTTGGNILGWRFDWASNPSVNMEIDYISLTTLPLGSTTVAPSVTTNYYVRYEGQCNTTACASTTVNVTPLPSGGSITGITPVAHAAPGVSYSVSGVSNATSYTWSAPAGATVASGQGTASVTVDWGTSSGGNITCTPYNGTCPGTALSFTVVVSGCYTPTATTTTAVPSSCGVTLVDYWHNTGSYCTLTGVAASTQYKIVSSAFGSNYFTITKGAPNGQVVAAGISPLTWTSVGAGTYYAHVTDNSSCGTGAAGHACITIEQNLNSGLTAQGFGNNFWNVNVYGHLSSSTVIDLSTFAGYYTENNISFNTNTRWNNTAAPSDANSTGGNAYTGCSVSPEWHAYIYKRKGFPAGSYRIDITKDDGYTLIINGSVVSSNFVAGTVNNDAWCGQLNAASEIEIQCFDWLLNSQAIVTFTPLSSGVSPGDLAVCSGINPGTFTASPVGFLNTPSYLWYKNGISTGITTQTYDAGVLTNPPSSSYTVFCTVSGDGCSVSTPTTTITVNPYPVAAGTVSGTATVCQGQSGLVYSVPAITNATGYNWVYSGSGFSITSGTNTNSITAGFSLAANGGTLTVSGTNTCGNGTSSSGFPVTVNTVSTEPSTISGTTTICNGLGTTITASGGTSGTGATMEWFTGTCGGTPAGTGANITVAPNTNTTYFVRRTGTCNTTSCATQLVTVNSPSAILPTLLSNNDYVWWGNTSGDWNTASNWYVYNGSTFNIAASAPDSSKNVYLRSLGGCASNGLNLSGAGGNSGNIVIENGNTFTMSGGQTLHVHGNWKNSGTFNENNGCVCFEGFSNQQVNDPETFNNLIVNNAFGATLNANVSVAGALVLLNGTLNNGAYLSLANNATIIRNGGSLSNVPNFGASVNVQYTGAGTTGPEMPVNTTVLRNLSIDAGSNSIVALNAPVTVNNQLNLTSGVIRTSASNILTMADNTSVLGANATSFVDGPMRKIGDDAFEFPIGRVSGTSFVWSPIKIADPGGNPSDRFVAEYYLQTSPNSYYLSDMCSGSGLNHVSGTEYWDITREAGTTYPDVTIYYKDAQRSGITDLGSLAIAHYQMCNGSLKWASMGGTAVGGLGPGGQGQITGTGFTSYSPITFGAKSGGSNPLPVKLLSLDASCKGTENVVIWTTASEQNSLYFAVDRSTDMLNWQEVGRQSAAGNSSSTLSYEFTEVSLPDAVVYYRLKQVDVDGLYEFFGPVSLKCASTEPYNISVYPNPFNDVINVIFTGVLPEKTAITIRDILGKTVYYYESEFTDGSVFTLTPENKLSPGIYHVTINSGSDIRYFKIIKN
ncbi:MAG: DUF4082 domain-containing protein [Bacteroidota bacterium]